MHQPDSEHAATEHTGEAYKRLQRCEVAGRYTGPFPRDVLMTLFSC
jgi:hypothetical protein